MEEMKFTATEERYLEWVSRMDLSPEETVSIWEARMAVSRQLEEGPQFAIEYGLSASQLRAVDWTVREVYGPMYEAGIRPTIAWHPAGYWQVRYSVSKERGLYGFERMSGFFEKRVGYKLKFPPF